MPKPDDVQAVVCFLGFVNYLTKFLPQLSDLSAPLRRLTDKDGVWCWLPQHDKAIDSIKNLVTEHPFLRYYNENDKVTKQCHARKLDWVQHCSKRDSLWPMR